MSADTYYMLYCIGLLALALIGLPSAYLLGRRGGRQEGYYTAQRDTQRKIDSAVSDALNRQRRQMQTAFMHSSIRGRWNEDKAYRAAIAREETQILERQK